MSTRPSPPAPRILINDRSEVGAARRTALALTASAGFDETQAGKLALCVTEAATNIVKHAGSGQILLRALQKGGVAGIEMLALDKGPGIENLGASLRDGFSTAGSAGTGLGALSRLPDAFDLYAPPGKGTALRLEVWSSRPPETFPGEPIDVGAVCIPKTGEEVCGDAWSLQAAADYRTVMVADGLGHGPEAAKAAKTAIDLLANRVGEEPSRFIEICHRALLPTRGAAVAITRLTCARELGSFSGVGNICALTIIAGVRRQLISHNGTLGHSLRRIQQFEFPFPRGALLILHSDGLATHWNLADYPGLSHRHPGLIAGVLYRDHERKRDDVTVVVISNKASD